MDDAPPGLMRVLAIACGTVADLEQLLAERDAQIAALREEIDMLTTVVPPQATQPASGPTG